MTAAQNAANAANTLAGGKGKVLVQSTTPVAGDQLAQNLWIDTTGGANTPKRWSGSAWLAVTDKVATDAAAAAANALALATTKADASAVQSLTTRVTSAEGTISSQGTAITGLNNSLTTTNTNVTAAQNAANAANTLAGGKGKVLVQTAAPAAADQLAQNLWIDITGGANTPKRWSGTAWVAVTDKVATDAATAAANALAQVATKADASAVTSLSNTVTQQGNTIAAQGTAVTGLTNRIANAEGVNTAQSEAITQIDSKVTEIDGKATSTAAAFNALDAKVGDNAASLTTLEQAMVTADQALSQQITTLNSDYQGTKATVTQQITAVSNQSGATAGQVATLQTSVNGNTSAIQVVQNAQSTLEGKLTAQYAIKLQLTADGRTYAAGMGLDITTAGGITQSSILFQANRIAMINTDSGNVSLPFLMEAGTVYINNAMFKIASIDFAYISDTLQSTDYVANTKGWKLGKGGSLEFNGPVAGGGRLVMTNTFIKVYDGAGVKRVQLGDLSA